MVVAICIRLGSIGESVVTGRGVHDMIGTTAVKWENTSTDIAQALYSYNIKLCILLTEMERWVVCAPSCLVDGCQANTIDATCTDIPNGIGGSRSANIVSCGVAILNVLQFIIFYFWC